jgi:hypothetical protein
MTAGTRRSSVASAGLAIALLLLAAVAYTWATWRFFTLPVPGGNDFVAHYTAWEAYFRFGHNPYSDEAILNTQLAIYGRPALPDEDQNRLTYPFYSVIVHGPFVLLDLALARAVYMVLLQAALIAGVALVLRLVGWRPPPWLLACLVAWSLLSYPQARGIILGQFAILGFFALAGSLYLLRAARPGAAGAVLVLATIKPTLIFLVIPYLLLWAVLRRRWQFLAAFGLTFTVMLAGSLAALPTWIGDWLQRVRQYPEYTVGQSPVWLLAHQALPWLGQAGELALTALLLAAMLWAWWFALRPGQAADGDPAFHWALGMTLIVSNLIVPRSATTNYVLMLVPTLWAFAALDRWRRPAGRLVLLAVLLATLVGYWALHIATVVGNQEQPVLFLPWPLLLLAVLLAARRPLVDYARAARLWPADEAGTRPSVRAAAIA